MSTLFEGFFKKIFFVLSYYRNPPWDTNISPPELIEFISSTNPGKALDIGCGTGTNAITLAEHGWNVLAIDFVPKAIKIARKRIEGKNLPIQFVLDDIHHLALISDHFNLLLDIGCFHSLTEPQKRMYISRVGKLLVPGGTFLIYGFLKDQDNPNNGITDEDIAEFEKTLQLESQNIGTERDQIKSSWLKFVK